MAKKVTETTEDLTENIETPAVDERKAAAAKQRKEINGAKAVLGSFMATEAFTALDQGVKDAIERLAKKASNGNGGAGTSVLAQFTQLFPAVGHVYDEFDLFKQTKLGRSEMRKKVHYALKKCDVADRMWIRFDEPAEAWVLDAVGPTAPENWTENDLPKLRDGVFS